MWNLQCGALQISNMIVLGSFILKGIIFDYMYRTSYKNMCFLVTCFNCYDRQYTTNIQLLDRNALFNLVYIRYCMSVVIVAEALLCPASL